ncbi:MAG TPA: shikimate kinase [Clostridiaceae bacterium]|nr:shikimate kinase [Clostridiaceae bacterium]
MTQTPQGFSTFNGPIFLIGFMASGKSTVAVRLAHLLPGYNVIDTDQAIEKREGCTISDLFAKEGEAYFRDCETHFLQTIDPSAKWIVSCGGGIILREENRRFMQKLGPVIWLTAQPQTILDRTKGNNERPLLRGKRTVTAVQNMLDSRRESYEQAATHVIATDELSPSVIAKQIREMLTASPA